MGLSAAETKPGQARGTDMVRRPGEQRGNGQPRTTFVAMPEALPLPRPAAARSPPMPLVPSWRPQNSIAGAGQERVKDVLNKPNLHAKVSPPFLLTTQGSCEPINIL